MTLINGNSNALISEAMDPGQSTQSRLDYIDSLRLAPEGFGICDSVLDEVLSLISIGIDAGVVNIPVILDELEENETHATITKIENTLDPAAAFYDPAERPALLAWRPSTKRAIALQTIYRSLQAETLSDGIGANAYEVPISNGRSAREILMAEKSQEKVNKIVHSYDLLRTPLDENSRKFFQYSYDAQGIRNRALIAMELASQQLDKSFSDRQDFVSASLACGAAQPVYDLVNYLRDHGSDFSKVILVDKDPMALAAANALAESAGVKDIISIEYRDLFLENLTDYIKPQSVDVVDILGLFEYIPTAHPDFGNMAAEFLARAGEILRPGGVILIGNMLEDRPEQTFFTDAVGWPPLQQRSISEVLGIICDAGYDLDRVTVRVPSNDGVYATYAIAG